MPSSAESERRGCSRCAVSFEVIVQEFPPSTFSGGQPASIQGESRNISKSGMCLLLDQACAVSSILKCEVCYPSSSATIPTLARVLWIQNHRSKLVTGVEFLL